MLAWDFEQYFIICSVASWNPPKRKRALSENVLRGAEALTYTGPIGLTELEPVKRTRAIPKPSLKLTLPLTSL